MNIVSPQAWGAVIDYDSPQFSVGVWKPDKWVVHYGGATAYQDRDEKAVLRSWERYHTQTKRWRGIAYNYAIGMSGTVYRLRGEKQAAATSGDQDKDGIPENHEARAVVFIMGGNTFEPTAEAKQAFRDLYQTLGGNFPVIVHSDSTATQCPGPKLTAWVRSGGYKPSQGVQPPSGPPTTLPPPESPPATTERPVGAVSILSASTVSIPQMQRWAIKRRATPRFIQLAVVAFDESTRIGVDPAVTYAIMAHETGFGHFGNVLDTSFHNWGGIKTTRGGGNYDPNAHQRFVDDRTGVRAVAQHAGIYGGLYLPFDEVVDPRHFDYIRGKAPFIPNSGWTWAGSTHDDNIIAKVKEMRNA